MRPREIGWVRLGWVRLGISVIDGPLCDFLWSSEIVSYLVSWDDEFCTELQVKG